jgi:hypothetical protein
MKLFRRIPGWLGATLALTVIALGACRDSDHASGSKSDVLLTQPSTAVSTRPQLDRILPGGKVSADEAARGSDLIVLGRLMFVCPPQPGPPNIEDARARIDMFFPLRGKIDPAEIATVPFDRRGISSREISVLLNFHFAPERGYREVPPQPWHQYYFFLHRSESGELQAVKVLERNDEGGRQMDALLAKERGRELMPRS